jgi:uncharacterized membrane protein YcaP (DUF421 family)
MFFQSWWEIGRAVVVTTAAFFFIVAVMRLVGHRALAKMSPFDMLFTVALGSIVANLAVTKGVTVAATAASISTLLAWQEGVRWFQARKLTMHHLVRQPPRVLLWDGQLLEDRLLADSISADEVRAAVRRAGLMSLLQAQIVVLENDGEWSVVSKEKVTDDISAIYGLPIPGIPGNGPKDDGDKAQPASNYRIP